MGRGTGGLLMASLSSLGAIVSFSHFCDRNAVTGTTTFQYILARNHIPVDTVHRPQISPRLIYIHTQVPNGQISHNVCI